MHGTTRCSALVPACEGLWKAPVDVASGSSRKCSTQSLHACIAALPPRRTPNTEVAIMIAAPNAPLGSLTASLDALPPAASHVIKTRLLQHQLRNKTIAMRCAQGSHRYMTAAAFASAASRAHAAARVFLPHSTSYDNPALYSSDDSFSEQFYWDKRYSAEPTAFEWYRDYNSLATIIRT